ncbi:hypothetical protein HF324_02860 [Chitinophaga oryzae]|uniref:DUF3899 domain-containing protein n=1 Tax=Chitinophaga oryzae TaxID=2725414 RepID=A0ABX6L9R5_9BACT|nr:hypothetical protein [Chitinophaga oryzae]QJB36851.1 hypothetical protein HF324_02860 [Chitinophaga oryzae]
MEGIIIIATSCIYGILGIYCGLRGEELRNRWVIRTHKRISLRVFRESEPFARTPEDIRYLRITKRLYVVAICCFWMYILMVVFLLVQKIWM